MASKLLSKVRLLLIDGDITSNNIIENELKNSGFNVTTVLKAEDALKKIDAEEDYELLIINHNLPDMALLKFLSQLEIKHKKVPFILLTENEISEISIQVIRKGAVEYVIKDKDFLKSLPEVVMNCIQKIQMEKHLKDIQKFRKYNEECEIHNRAKGLFLANLSTELRSPVNDIYNSIDLLSTINFENGHQKYLEVAKNAADRLVKMIKNLADLSEVELETLNIEKEEIILKDFITKIVEAFYKASSDKNLPIMYFIESDVPEKIIGDSKKIRKVLINFIDNAVKFSEEGIIILRISKLGDFQEYKTIKFEVIDTGIGIAKERLGKLFDKYSRNESDMKGENGLGIGLTTCKRLIELLDGEIGIESKLGKGSTFWFAIKLEEAENEKVIINGRIKEKNKEELPTTNSLIKILLVEDHRINRELTKSILMKKGYIVSEAGDGVEALELFEKNDYDLIILDVEMPRMDGLDAARNIRKINENIPIIAMTAYAAIDDEKMCLKAGMNEYIAKPFTPEVLFLTIDNLLNTKL